MMRRERTTRAETKTAERVAGAARLLAAALVLLALAATALVAQEPRELSLEEAIRLAKNNNPNFQSTVNDRDAADWQVRQAYANLLPSASLSGSMGYQESGRQNFGTGVDLGVAGTDWYSSSYRLGFSWNFSGQSIFGIGAARASQRATEAGITAAEFNLEQTVTLQYMTALRARDGADVARDTYERAQQNFEIVNTRVETGFAAGTEGYQAEVDMGRAEVQLLQAERLYRAELQRLQEQMGVPMGLEVDLVSAFPIFEPMWERDALIDDAIRAHPSLRAARARQSSSRAQVRSARSSYMPSVSVSTSLFGYTNQALNEGFVVNQVRGSFQSAMENCEQLNAISAGLTTPLPDYPRDCQSRYAFTPQDSINALSSNDVFPFDFTKSPMSVSLSVSIPLFNGFSRQVQVEQAVAQSKDAANNVRAAELQLRTAVTQSLDNVESAYRQVEIETRNRELAEMQLVTARERYQAGNTSILELMDAQTSLSTAERDYLNAVYTFHQSLTALEAATGRSLRPGDDDDDDDGGAEG